MRGLEMLTYCQSLLVQKPEYFAKISPKVWTPT